jgi:N-acyl-D-aspartate/D-glutamate deacylase
MPGFDIVIKNGLISDGTRVPRYRGDTGIRGGLHDLPVGEWRRVQRASRYRYVLVSGGVTVENDCETNTYSGRLLRGGGTLTGAAA